MVIELIYKNCINIINYTWTLITKALSEDIKAPEKISIK